MLQVRNLTGGYAKNHDVLQGINLEIAKGDSVGIIGLNGSGKSSLAKAILNILPFRQGEIFFNNIDITKKSTQELSEMGIVLFMQGGRVFDELSVWENLLISTKNEENIKDAQMYFPLLSLPKNKLQKMKADKFSGGERSLLALICCLLRKPSLLILDEPSAGLAPHAVDEIYQSLNLLRSKDNLSIILIEQNITRCIEFCRSVNVLGDGKITYHFDNKDINSVEEIMFNKRN